MIVSVYSPTFDSRDSYGKIASKLASGLRSRVEHVNTISLDVEDKENSLRLSLGGFLLGYPTAATLFGPMFTLGPKIAITMFESTKLPPGWVGELNNCDAVIVPSRWVASVFRSCGVTSEIFVIPLGVDEEYEFAIRNNPVPTFLTIGDRDTRKGWTRAAEAFYRAFGLSDRAKLIVKSRSRNRLIRLDNPNIEMICEDYDLDEMVRLYQRCDFMIFPSTGEGFGLPPREFAATGGIAFATNFSGLEDDIDKWGVPIDYSLTPAWQNNSKFRNLGDWANPSIEDLTNKILNHSFWLKMMKEEQGKVFSDNVKALYSWDHFVEQCFEVWKQVSLVSSGV